MSNVSNAAGGEFATARRGSIDLTEVTYIQARAAQGFPASQIAKQIGRHESDVRPWMVAKAKPEEDEAIEPPVVRHTYVLSLWKGIIAVPTNPVTMREVVDWVAQRHGLTAEQIRGPQRPASVAKPRQEAMWRMYRSGRWSLNQIGRFLGDRDHTTVLHGVRAHEKRLEAQRAADIAAWQAFGESEAA